MPEFKQVQFTPTQIMSVLSMLYPFFMMIYFFLSASFNYKISGLLFLAGISFLWMTGYGISIIFAKGNTSFGLYENLNTCNMFAGLLPYQSDIPQFSTALCFFLLVVVIMPMTGLVQSNPVINIVLLGFMAIMTFAHVIWIMSRTPACSSWTGVLWGGVLGTIIGLLYFFVLWAGFSNSRDQVLFFNEILSDNVVCSKPAKTLFKCSVSKGGTLIGGTV